MKSMFRSLRIRNFRIWFIGSALSGFGTWMLATALSWVVLTEITDNDAYAMGVTLALQFGPPLVFVGITGWAADRFDRRQLLIFTQLLQFTLVGVMGLFLLFDAATLAVVFVFAFCFGTVNAFDNPTRLAFVADLVSPENASNAIGLNAASFHGSRMIGPAGAGLLLANFDSAWAFLINAFAFAGMAVALLLLRRAAPTPSSLMPKRVSLTAGFLAVARRPDILLMLCMVFTMSAFSMNFPIFGSTMVLEFDRGVAAFGILSSTVAFGSVTGALVAARLDKVGMRIVSGASALLGLTLFAASIVPTYEIYTVATASIGFSIVLMLTTSNTYVQLTSDIDTRGRILAIYAAVIMGGTPVGAPIIGYVVEILGPRAAMVVGAAAALFAAAAGAIWMLNMRRKRRASVSPA